MKLNIQESNAAGNTTLFVLSTVEETVRSHVAQRLAQNFPHIEQIGFIEPNRLTMAGGEFCGNASRAYALYLAQKNHLTQETTLRVSVSGSPEPLEAVVKPSENFVSIEMPLPTSIVPYEEDGIQGHLVTMEGIVHLILQDQEASLARFNQIKRIFFRRHRPEAFGAMFLMENNTRLTPIVHVPALDSTHIEGSCASGTLACACVLAADAESRFTFSEPQGTLCARVFKTGETITKATVEGLVEFLPPQEIIL